MAYPHVMVPTEAPVSKHVDPVSSVFAKQNDVPNKPSLYVRLMKNFNVIDRHQVPKIV